VLYHKPAKLVVAGRLLTGDDAIIGDGVRDDVIIDDFTVSAVETLEGELDKVTVGLVDDAATNDTRTDGICKVDAITVADEGCGMCVIDLCLTKKIILIHLHPRYSTSTHHEV